MFIHASRDQGRRQVFKGGGGGGGGEKGGYLWLGV